MFNSQFSSNIFIVLCLTRAVHFRHRNKKQIRRGLMFRFYIRQDNASLAQFSAGINPDAYWSFLLFNVPEWGRRQDGESCGRNYKLNPFIIEAIRPSAIYYCPLRDRLIPLYNKKSVSMIYESISVNYVTPSECYLESRPSGPHTHYLPVMCMLV